MDAHRQFSLATERELQEMLRWWRQSNRGGQLGDAETKVPPIGRIVRWAKTAVTEDVPDYPTAGNVLPIQLGEYVFDDTTTGSQSPTFTAYGSATDRDERIAYFPQGYKPLGSIVRLTLHDGMWFEISNQGSLLHYYTPSTGIPSRSGTTLGSASCERWTVDVNYDLQQLLVSGSPVFHTVLNKSTSMAITGDTHIMAEVDDGGHHIAIWEDCSA